MFIVDLLTVPTCSPSGSLLAILLSLVCSCLASVFILEHEDWDANTLAKGLYDVE